LVRRNSRLVDWSLGGTTRQEEGGGQEKKNGSIHDCRFMA